MKKLVCIFLTAAMCFSLCGCVQEIAGGGIKLLWSAVTSVPQWEQRAMLRHLEKKYDEKFVIKEILYPSDESSLSRGAIVYPEGKEDEEFRVSLGTKGNRTCIDDYVVKLQAKRITPLYEELVQGTIPSAKVYINISGLPEKDMEYDPEQSLQEFVNEANKLSIDVNIVLSETELENRDELFKNLSKLPEAEPISGFWSVSYNIAFYTQEAFNETVPSKDMRVLINPAYENYIVAATSFIYIRGSNTEQKWPYLDQLNDKFETKEETQ